MGRGSDKTSFVLPEVERFSLSNGLDEFLQAEEGKRRAFATRLKEVRSSLSQADKSYEPGFVALRDLFEEDRKKLLGLEDSESLELRDALFDEVTEYFHSSLFNERDTAFGVYALMLRTTKGTSPLVSEYLVSDKKKMPRLHLRETPESEIMLCGIKRDVYWSHGFVRGVFTKTKAGERCEKCRKIALTKYSKEAVGKIAKEKPGLRFLGAKKSEWRKIDKAAREGYLTWLASDEEISGNERAYRGYVAGLHTAMPEVCATRFYALTAEEKFSTVFDRWMSSELRVFPDGESLGNIIKARHPNIAALKWPDKKKTKEIYASALSEIVPRESDPLESEKRVLALMTKALVPELVKEIIEDPEGIGRFVTEDMIELLATL
jgi:hypothetical protein